MTRAEHAAWNATRKGLARGRIYHHTLDTGETLKLAGKRVSAWRQRIGNAVPPPAACAIAKQMIQCLIAADGDQIIYSATASVWVAPTELTSDERYFEWQWTPIENAGDVELLEARLGTD